MNIVMEYGERAEELTQVQYDFAFYGADLDQRCSTAIEYIKEKSKCCKNIYYQAENSKLIIDGEYSIWVDDTMDALSHLGINSMSTILLECTSLGVVELLILMQSLKDLDCISFNALYLEPLKYSLFNFDFTERHKYNLSLCFEGLKSIPGHALSFESGDKAVFLCGFESERVGRAIEEIGIRGYNCQLIFAMPPFSFGWDMNSYLNHIPVINGNHLPTEFYYVGASNPLAVYHHLMTIYDGLDDNQKMFILPFGTKPMSIGACLFKVSKEANNLSISYDHPIRRNKRSTDIGHWNLYRITL